MQAAEEIAGKTHNRDVNTEDFDYDVECRMIEQLRAEDCTEEPKYTPLAGAVKSGNRKLFWQVYDTVLYYKGSWNHKTVRKPM